MSVIIRLQNLPWSANALDIRNFFRGLSIPEGGVHIVGGELGDAFIAFSTDEDARQAMMLDCGKIKEIQVKLLLSSRSEMHKVIEAARQSVPILTLTAPAPAPAPAAPPVPVPVVPPITVAPAITPFSPALGNNPLSSFGIPGIGNPQEIPQPAVIEPPLPQGSPPVLFTPEDDDEKPERKRSKEKDKRRSRSRSRSRDRERKDRKRDRRDRSRSRERRRRDRSRSRDRRDRKRDRKDRSRSRDRSPSRRSRDRRNNDRKSPQMEKPFEMQTSEGPVAPPPPIFANVMNNQLPVQPLQISPLLTNSPIGSTDSPPSRFSDPGIVETFNKLHELGKKRNPNAFQGEQQNGAGRFPGAMAGRGGRGGNNMRGTGNFRRENRISRFDNDAQRDCCVAIRNAPNHSSYGDIRRFFPFMIDKHGIKMINDNMGRRTGNIYVRFCDSRSKHLALQRKGNELKGAQVVVEALEDEAYETAVDSFLPFREENDEEDPSLVIADEVVAQPAFSVLKLTDLPHFVKEHDIIKAFSEFSLLSIMINDCRVTRSKTAYVQFVKTDDAKEALSRKEKYIFGRRHPTIIPIADEEYDKEKLTSNERVTDPIVNIPPPIEIDSPQEQPEPVVPRDPRQRRQKFDNGPAPNTGGTQQANPQVPPFFPTPFGPGQFATPPAQFSNPPYGGFPGNAMDPRTATNNWANRPAFPPVVPMRNQNVIDLDEEPLDCILMKGLPRNATDRTIVTFLSDTGAVPARIHLMLDSSNTPSGDCFCEFRSNHEARMAISKHGKSLEGYRVTIDLVSRSMVQEALEPKQLEPPAEPLLGNGPQFFEHQRGGFPPRGSFRGRGGFDRGFDRNSYRGGFDSNRGFESSRGGFDTGRGGGYRGRFNDRGRGFDRSRGRGYRGRGGFEQNGREREMREEDQDPALEDFGAPGCVVSMENVPFRATVDDIMNFFSEFELTQDDIIRRYNERGQPTGDARVAFRTPFDAQRAVKTRHMDNIHDRRINLTIL